MFSNAILFKELLNTIISEKPNLQSNLKNQIQAISFIGMDFQKRSSENMQKGGGCQNNYVCIHKDPLKDTPHLLVGFNLECF